MKTELRKCTTAKNKIEKEKHDEVTKKENWQREHDIVLQEPITAEVIINNDDEGVSVDKMADHMLHDMDKMKSTNINMTGVIEAVEEVLTKLQDYMDELQEEINDLYASL